MDGDRTARLVPIVLAVILGLLGMHALVVVDGGHPMPSTPSMPQVVMSSPATTMPMSGDPVAPMSPMSPATPPIADSTGAADVAAPLAPEGGHSDGHELLHLCLAVLTALLALLAGLVLPLTTGSARGADENDSGRWRRDPPRRPPPTSVRLARLCVMRT